MTLHAKVRLLAVSGGLYAVRAEEDDATGTIHRGDRFSLKARGAFRHQGETPLVGDLAVIRMETDAAGRPDCEHGILMESLLPRKNELIRPPMANLDYLLITVAAASPAPSVLALDKLTAACEAQKVTPLLIINKCELSPETARELSAVYSGVGYRVFSVSARDGTGEGGLRAALSALLPGKTAAFAGASGVGKSSCMNMLFPQLGLQTNAVSARTGRGRHTTRAVSLLPLTLENGAECFLADTPGFGLLDFENYDFLAEDELIWAFPEFEPYLTHCRYTKCTHTKEEGCAILAAVREGKIAPSRQQSYALLREELKRRALAVRKKKNETKKV